VPSRYAGTKGENLSKKKRRRERCAAEKREARLRRKDSRWEKKDFAIERPEKNGYQPLARGKTTTSTKKSDMSPVRKEKIVRKISNGKRGSSEPQERKEKSTPLKGGRKLDNRGDLE